MGLFSSKITIISKTQILSKSLASKNGFSEHRNIGNKYLQEDKGTFRTTVVESKTNSRSLIFKNNGDSWLEFLGDPRAAIRKLQKQHENCPSEPSLENPSLLFFKPDENQFTVHNNYSKVFRYTFTIILMILVRRTKKIAVTPHANRNKEAGTKTRGLSVYFLIARLFWIKRRHLSFNPQK